jgi:CHAP domain
MRHMTAALAATAAAAALPATAEAETRLTDVPSARPGQAVTIRAVTTDSDRCRLRIAGRSKSLRVTGFTRSRFTLRLSRRARPGRYPVLLRCHDQSDAAVLRVRPRRGARTASRRQIVAGPIRARAHRRPIGVDHPQVTAAWRQERAGNDEFFLGAHDSTSWAYARRPDIVEAVVRQTIADALNDRWPDSGLILTSWNPASWDDNAAAAGLSVSAFPRAGDIMVWQLSADDGHLAYVEQVLSGGAVRVSEMGWDGAPGVVTRRTITPAQMAGAFEVVFIHRSGQLGL